MTRRKRRFARTGENLKEKRSKRENIRYFFRHLRAILRHNLGALSRLNCADIDTRHRANSCFFSLFFVLLNELCINPLQSEPPLCDVLWIIVVVRYSLDIIDMKLKKLRNVASFGHIAYIFVSHFAAKVVRERREQFPGASRFSIAIGNFQRRQHGGRGECLLSSLFSLYNWPSVICLASCNLEKKKENKKQTIVCLSFATRVFALWYYTTISINATISKRGVWYTRLMRL